MYSFVLKQCKWTEDVVADTLSRVSIFVNSLRVKVVRFERIIQECPICRDFSGIYAALLNTSSPPSSDFHIHDEYLFKGTCLCIPSTLMREYLLWELHAGGLTGHFDRDKSIVIVVERSFWPSLKRDVARFVSEYHTC